MCSMDVGVFGSRAKILTKYEIGRRSTKCQDRRLEICLNLHNRGKRSGMVLRRWAVRQIAEMLCEICIEARESARNFTVN